MISVVVHERDQLIEALRFENITGRRFLDPPVHRMTCYRDMSGDISLPITDFVASRAIALPVFSDMALDDVQKIFAAIADIYDHRVEVREYLHHDTNISNRSLPISRPPNQ